MSEAGLTGEGAAGTPGTNKLRQNKTKQFERSMHSLVPKRTGFALSPCAPPRSREVSGDKEKGCGFRQVSYVAGTGLGLGEAGTWNQARLHPKPGSRPPTLTASRNRRL